MAGYYQTSAAQQPPSTPPLPPIRHSSSQNTLRHASSFAAPPSTPPNKYRTAVRDNGKAREPAIRPRQTTASSNRREERQRAATTTTTSTSPDTRHSHGLSWSSTTRDSLVDNLLTSLDGLSQLAERDYTHDSEPHGSDIEWARFDAINAMNNNSSSSNIMPRSRGHTYSSSLSDDRAVMPDSPASITSTPVHKGRRSGSNSGSFAAGSQHTLSSRRPARPFAREEKVLLSERDKFYKGQTAAVVNLPNHTRDWSNASSTNEVFMDALEAPRLPFGGPRSMSVDNIRPMSSQDSILHRGRPVPSVFSRYETASFEAAPEPMVPAGPRKLQNPNATGPVYVNAAPKQSALRKITTQSDLRAVSTPAVPADVRERASDFVRSSSMMDAAYDHHHQSGGVTASAAAVTQSTRRDPTTPHQEKPGFFKRVFGGGGGASKNANVDRPDTSHNTLEAKLSSPLPPLPKLSQDSRQVSADHSIASNVPSASHLPSPPPPPPQPTPTAAAAAAPTLSKKPSSFFRRRKKSTGEDRPAPPPLTLSDRAQPDDPSRSSISSLRKVMDQFLNEDPIKSATKAEFSRPTTRASVVSDDLDIFHSGYTPPVVDMTRSKSSKSVGARSMESPKMKLKVKKRTNDAPLPPATATSQSSMGSGAVDAALQNQSALSFINTTADTSHIEPPKVSPLLDGTPIVNDDRRVSAIPHAELSTTPEASQEMRDFAAGNNVDLNMDSETWLMPHDKVVPSRVRPSTATNRLVLVPSNEGLAADQGSSGAVTPQLKVDDPASPLAPPALPKDGPYERAANHPVETIAVPRDGSVEASVRARRIFNGDETDLSKMDAASWLGESKAINIQTLQEYMRLFDFAQMNILTALRTLCSRLILRGETQQFDRIITALSARWYECNPNNGFKAQDVVHTICYSLILLNTDLHLADIGEKMSRNAYVKNTLPTIKRVVADAAPAAFSDTVRPAPSARPSVPWTDTYSPTSPAFPPDTPQERTSFEGLRPQGSGLQKRNSIRPNSNRNDSDGPEGTASNALVSTTSTGGARAWENEIEAVLKSFFNSIRTEPLPLLSLDPEPAQPDRTQSASGSALKRTGSIVSKAPSDNPSSSRSRATGLRSLTLGFQSRNNRSRQKVFSTNTMSSSRTSFDDGGMWSPAQSSTWSKTSMGKTLTSASMNSLAASYMGSSTDREFKHSIGFANALSHAIIREEGGGVVNADSDSLLLRGDLLEDESLTLEGAPWAKEGMVKHKHHLEAPDRKSKERSWSECFAVISRGKLTLFNFNTVVKSRSLGRPRTKQGSQPPSLAGNRVGGGDWMENAEQLGTFVLRHTISSTLPPPGYSKARPFVWALSLPSGAVHLFQVGTPEIAEEWMTTANYWSARLSKEPLSGGVSNIEYGWSDSVVNTSLLEKSESFNSPPPSIANRAQTHARTTSTGTGRSLQSSIRTSFDVGGASKQRLPGDKIHITEWSPPSQSIMASQLPEAEQLKALSSYVANVEDELEKHHALKHGIELAYSPRHNNYGRAMNNWQRKSEYLLREVVKFRTYMDSLAAAQKSRDDVYARRAERAPARVAPTQPAASNSLLSPTASHDLRRTASNISVSTVSLHASDV